MDTDGKFYARLGAHLNTAKDLIIALGGAVYFLGYLIWSYYAWRYHLGPVPALQGQYFVAGLVASCFLLITGAFIWLAVWLADIWWPRYLAGRSVAVRRTLLSLAALLLFGGIAVVIVSTADAPSTAVWQRAYITIGVLAIVPFVFSRLRLAPRLTQRVIRPVLITYVATISILTLFRTVEQSYPVWPQELGGGRPRMAYLTLYRSAVDGGGLTFLIHQYVKAPPDSPVVQTIPVYVLVRTSDYLVVSTYEPNRSFNGEPTREEVPTKAIASISWFDSR